MTVRSVIEVDVSTAEFARYKSLFDAYTEQLKKQPAMWAAISQQHKTLTTQLKHTSDAIDDEHSKLEDLAKIQDGNEQRLMKQEGLWSSIATRSESFAKNLISAGSVLAKWGLGGAVAGLGGIWGLDRMAHGVADQRRSAMGLGLTTGQQKAFHIDMARIVDPDSFLTGINTARTDLTKAGSLYSLGVNPSGSTSDVALATLRALSSQTRGMSANMLGVFASSHKLGDLGLNPEDLVRIQSMSKTKEFGSAISNYQRDSQSLGVSERTGKAWTDFVAGMERAGATLSKIFVTGLLPLAGPVQHLATAFAHLVGVVMAKNGIVEQGINHLAGWLNGLAGKLDSTEFLSSVAKFTASLTDMADAMNRIAHPFDTAASGLADVGMGIKDWLFPSKGSVTASPQAYMNYLGRRDLVTGLPAGTTEALFQANGGQLYPKRGADGGMGAFEISPDLAKQLGIDAGDPAQSANGVSTYLGSLFQKFHGDLQETLTAFKLGPAQMAQFLSLIAAHPKDWQQFGSKQTQDTLHKVEIIIHNIPGGSTPVAASQLAH